MNKIIVVSKSHPLYEKLTKLNYPCYTINESSDLGIIEDHQDATIFDVYQGKGIEQGKKSIAFSILIQPNDRTLTDKELEEIQQKVLDAVTRKTGASLR